jgi:hypothetical protein
MQVYPIRQHYNDGSYKDWPLTLAPMSVLESWLGGDIHSGPGPNQIPDYTEQARICLSLKLQGLLPK